MPRSGLRRRFGALALLLAAVWLQAAAAGASPTSCCPRMGAASAAPPCHADPAPCESVDAMPCCDVPPAAAPLLAHAECHHAAAASLLRPLPSLALPAACAWTPQPIAALDASPQRLSVVLRN